MQQKRFQTEDSFWNEKQRSKRKKALENEARAIEVQGKD